MAKIVELGSGGEDDPVFFRGWTIGPVLASKPPTRTGSEESRQETATQGNNKEPQRVAIGQTVALKCIEYGDSNDASQIPPLFALYREWIDKSTTAERSEELQALAAAIEQRRGRAILALMPFITAETEPQIISTAALSLCNLFPVEDDPLAGPRFLGSVLCQNPVTDATAGAALGGMMLLGDERVSGLIRQIWDKWPSETRIEAVRRHSPFVLKAHIDLLLEFLAIETDLATYGSIAAALANAAVRADKNGVCEVERVFPAWSAPDQPVKIKSRWSRHEFATEIRSQLNHLIEAELTGPGEEMIMPIVLRRWLGDFS